MEKFCKQMKALSKIAILIGFIVCISSCQKEDNLSPLHCPSENNSSKQRLSGPSGNEENTDPSGIRRGEQQESTEEDIVGGGDDDRDGGGKKIIKKGG